MISRDTVGDAAANLLERRWFAAFKAASGVRAECEALLESMAITQAAWSQARVRLSELEALRDALGEELEALDEREERILARDSREVMSAA
jgi:hypothetical protein